MNILHALLLGIVEGLTEFLPVSSTFHLLIVTKLIGIAQSDFSKFFDVFIQSGAILAIVVLFAKEWFSQIEMLKKVAISFIPTAIIGFLLHKVIKGVFFESFGPMIIVFTLIGVVFLVLEAWLKKNPEKLAKTVDSISWKEAVVIGLAQAVAVFPGVSRAGAVMIAMLLMGYRRDEAAKYSFTLAVPTLLAASALDLIKMKGSLSSFGPNVTVLAVGTVTAFVTALVVVRWFIQFLRKRNFEVFGWYRIIAGPILFLIVK